MIRKDEVLFAAFELIARESNGIVTRGGIFTATHPRLKATFQGREVSVFFQKERQALNICIRIAGDFPVSIEILPRFSTLGAGSRNNRNNILELPAPFNENFSITADNHQKCLDFITNTVFIDCFQEMLSPAILEEKFFEEFKIKDEDNSEKERFIYRETEESHAKISRELDELEIPRKRYFFYPNLVLDRKGAFLKLRFDHYRNEEEKISQETQAAVAAEVKEVIVSYINNLIKLLDEKGLIL